ncbi:MAG: ABC transporter substrate-binding protein [Pseudomonadota bacterium]
MTRIDLTISRRRFLAGTAIGAAGLVGLPRIGPALAQGAPRRGGVLRHSIVRRPNTLNPLKHINEAEYVLGELMYSALTRLDHRMRPAPDLATAWEPNADVTEWTFRLRQGVRFHHGPEVTAKDVVATFETLLDEKTASPGRRNVGPIEKVVDIDPSTVRFKTSVPYGDLPVMVAHTTAKILPRDVLERDLKALDNAEYGSGPFKVKSYDPARLCRVERNPDYYDKDQPYLDAVEQVYYPDATAEVTTFLNREVDILLEVPAPDFDRLAKTPGVDAMRVGSGRFPNIVLGNDQKPFNDVRVRQALALALDREQLVALVLDGFGRPGFDNPISREYRFHKALPPLKAEPQKARRLLAEAGYPNGLEITMVAANSPVIRGKLAVSARELARPAGFNINVQTMPYDTYLAQVWKKGNCYVGWYNMQPTEDGLFKLLYTSDAAWNETRWNNAEFDGLVNKARAAADENLRRDLYGRAQEMMAREVPAIIPIFVDLLAAKHKYVQGYAHHPRGAIYNLERVWLADGAPRRA